MAQVIGTLVVEVKVDPRSMRRAKRRIVGFRNEIRSAKGHRVSVEHRDLSEKPGPADGSAPRVSPTELLETISGQVRRLTITRSAPDRFFEDRSEIAANIQKVAQLLREAGMGGSIRCTHPIKLGDVRS